MSSTEYQDKDVRIWKDHTATKNVNKHAEGKVEIECTQLKLGVWNAAEGATQDFQRLVNIVACELELKSIDVMGLCEANVYPNTVKSCLNIPGYSLEVGRGVKKDVGANARVIAYVSDEVEYKRLEELEERSEMPAIWLELGTGKKTKFTLGIIYREHKSWRGKEAELRLASQQKRWRDWLNTYHDIWEGDREVLVMGDFNIDLKRKESGCKARMQQDTRSKILSKGWWQLITEKTFKSKSKTVKGKEGGSTIDWILTNKPDNIVKTKAEWTGSGADHAIVWAMKEMREKFRRKQMTRKRIWKDFSIEELKQEADKLDWTIKGTLTNKTSIENAVKDLEGKIKQVMEKVAPMKTLEKKRKRSKWLSKGLKNKIEEVKKARMSYMKTGCPKKKEEWKKERRQVGKEVRQAKKMNTRKGIEDKSKCSKTLWQGVKDHLGWESTGAPTMLEVGEGQTRRSIQAPGEIAEAIKMAFENKGRTVKKAIGRPKGNYLELVQNLHLGNVGKFHIGPITSEDVRKRLKVVPNKPSYGEDEISYTDLKLLAEWVTQPLARIFEASVKQGAFPQRWKSSRIKPLWKGEGNPKEKASSYRPVALLSATGRLLEGIVAERMDKYAEERGIVHKKVHGFRKGRGVGTGML